MTPFQANTAFPNLQHHPDGQPRSYSDKNLLTPEDAFLAHSPPRRQREAEVHSRPKSGIGNGDLADARAGGAGRRRREKERGRSGSRRRKGVWKKLLWVKQKSYPDNYTDPPTFLSHLQRNPRLLPYDFWPLVADSTVIVQHVCSVAIFVCCFVGIFQERVSPVSVVGWGSTGTVLGWVFWDFWVGQEEAAKALAELNSSPNAESNTGDAVVTGTSSVTNTAGTHTYSQTKDSGNVGLGLSLSNTNQAPRQSPPQPHSSVSPSSGPFTLPVNPYGPSTAANPSSIIPYNAPASPFSPRTQQRLATVKSAILIYSALLGLSPILKSLTISTTSDSIWALSTWLMCINVFFFDYGGGVGVKFPASLSTNAAVMASTVLASRLPSTTHVFSLTLFSIEVFGLFPVFRRHLRHISWRGHLFLTFALVVGAGTGMGIVLASREAARWKAVVGGVGLWGVGSVGVMGGCSWWLIGLQKYKNVVIGPWDPARPVIRQGVWE